MPYTDLLYSAAGGVATITLNRPEKLNAFRQQTLEELIDAFRSAAYDRSIGVIVFTGAGEKAFCVGGDISEMRDLDPQSGKRFVDTLFDLTGAIRQTRKPVLCKVRGYCLGGGHELHLFCDLTFAGEKARFGQTGPMVGSVPVWGGTQLIPRLVGDKRAREIVFGCKQYSAAEAKAMGLINDCAPEEKLDGLVKEWCDRILTMSPQALAIAKDSFNHALDTETGALSHGLELLRLLYGSEELREGMSAFLEKRKPDFGKFRR